MKYCLYKKKLLLGFVLVSNIILAQTKTVSGTVRDNQGSPLPGVNVVVDGTTNGTQTDFDGNYSIEVSEGEMLRFSYIGMVTASALVSSTNILDIVMQEDTNLLDEVVVTGYSKQSTRNITGSVTVVNTEDLAATSPVNVEQSLQGQASGVVVGSEGGPGGEALVRIRGFGTINNNDPLYIIDGTPTTSGIRQLNPADIESIQILKDASSAAIYGFRAANGVIIITTKGGKYNSKSKVEIGVNTGIDFVAKSDFPKFLSPQESANVIWQRFQNDGVAPSHPQYGNGASPVLPNYLTPTGADSVDESTYDPLTNKITRANKKGTNWFDEYFDPALVQNYTLGMSGGSESAKFNVGMGFLKQDGVALETYFDRYTLRVNSEFKATENIRIGESFNISYSDRVAAGGNQNTGGDISFLYRADPILPVYDIAGNYAGTRSVGLGNGFNSVAAAKRNKDNIFRSLRALGNVYVEVDLLEGLTFKTNIGLDYDTSHWSTFRFLNPEVAEPNAVNGLTENTIYTISSTWFNTLNYAKDFGQHNINVLLGTEFFKNQFKQFGATRNEFFTNSLDYRYLDAGTGTSTNYGYGGKRSYFSSFGKIDYNYSDKYLVSFSMRRDATSRFAKNTRVGYFPSYSAAWRLSNEKFLEDSNVINDLKLKLGYGELGNESIPQGRVENLYGNDINTSNYSVTGSNSSVAPGYNLTSIGNPDLKWETTTTKNIGVGGILFDNKLNFSFEYYISETKDMLLQSAGDITIIGHVTAPYANLGSMENKGFDFSVGYNGRIGEELKFNASANISAYKNKVLSLTDNPDYFLNGNAARETYPSRTQAGQALASFHGFIIDGIIQNEAERDAAADYGGKNVGTFKYRDVVPDGVIDDNDRTFIGSPHPDFTYGLNLGMEYKNFDLSVLFQGSEGNDIYNFTRFFTDFNSFPGAKSYRYQNSWSPDNTSGGLPQLTNNPAQHYSSASTYYIEDGSYLRLKNIQLGYNLPEALTSKIGVESLRLFIQGKNLFTWTQYSGLDPEINLQSYGGDDVNLDIGIDRGAYPIAKSVLFGLNLTL
ncbi:SusC/RagA family TonB-linked outer membrane protein [Flagellimonas olearia]|uniref:SusC/RagA family TonB-linked outer membrane protein n=1 Tax=Flagellimonas olearia TaxID=552546 RepID=A0A6I1E1A6_9FLAO|nr:TonB-dependent receptor [Allomuricauda olearia]KAB7530199.1 SusC/RagA family TonB-linked outer membrane protein [Allomuricauda olearia]